MSIPREDTPFFLPVTLCVYISMLGETKVLRGHACSRLSECSVDIDCTTIVQGYESQWCDTAYRGWIMMFQHSGALVSKTKQSGYLKGCQIFSNVYTSITCMLIVVT